MSVREIKFKISDRGFKDVKAVIDYSMPRPKKFEKNMKLLTRGDGVVWAVGEKTVRLFEVKEE